MRNCPRCLNTAVIEDGYCGVCGGITTPPLEAQVITELEQLRSQQHNSIAAAVAHRACCGTEHDPAQGKLHGYCVVCGVPWPCETANKFLGSLDDFKHLKQQLSDAQKQCAAKDEALNACYREQNQNKRWAIVMNATATTCGQEYVKREELEKAEALFQSNHDRTLEVMREVYDTQLLQARVEELEWIRRAAQGFTTSDAEMVNDRIATIKEQEKK